MRRMRLAPIPRRGSHAKGRGKNRTLPTKPMSSWKTATDHFCGATHRTDDATTILCAQDRLIAIDSAGSVKNLPLDTAARTAWFMMAWRRDSLLFHLRGGETAVITNQRGNATRKVSYSRLFPMRFGDRSHYGFASGALLLLDRRMGPLDPEFLSTLRTEGEFRDTLTLVIIGGDFARTTIQREAAGEYRVTIGRVPQILEPPLVRRLLVAAGPDRFATAYSDQNVVEVFRDDGSELGKIKAPNRRDLLAPADRERILRDFSRGTARDQPYRERLIGSLPPTVHWPELNNLFVDADARIWVERYGDRGCSWDVYGRALTQLAVVRSPCGMQLRFASGRHVVGSRGQHIQLYTF